MPLNTINKLTKSGLHSHIHGISSEKGLNGHDRVRKALDCVSKNLQKSRFGQLIFIKGRINSGKTALVQALRQEQQPETPFIQINSIEINSAQISKIEFLNQALRRATGLQITEMHKVVEGEVVKLSADMLKLKTLDMESTFEIGEKMCIEIEMEKISEGDIIRIVKEKGKILKLGRSSSKIDPSFISDVPYVNCPEGEMFKVIEEIQNLSLHDIDALNNRTHGYLGLFDGETGEISQGVRNEVNNKITEWLLERKAIISRGILCIEEAQLLDKDCKHFLNSALENSFCPTIILVTKDEFYTTLKQELPNSLTIVANKLLRDDIKAIITNKLVELSLQTDEQILSFLLELAETISITYVLNILAICKVKRNSSFENILSLDFIKEILVMFVDYKKIIVSK